MLMTLHHAALIWCAVVVLWIGMAVFGLFDGPLGVKLACILTGVAATVTCALAWTVSP